MKFESIYTILFILLLVYLMKYIPYKNYKTLAKPHQWINFNNEHIIVVLIYSYPIENIGYRTKA